MRSFTLTPDQTERKDEMHNVLEKVGPHRRRHTLPTSVLADPGFLVRLAELKLPLWEVISGPEFAACGDFSSRALADWRYLFPDNAYLPEPERKGLFPGNVNYYRLDVLMDWAESKGERRADRSKLWIPAADYLSSHGLRRPQNAKETDELLNWLWHNHVFHLRTVPKIVPYMPYSGPGNAAPMH